MSALLSTILAVSGSFQRETDYVANVPIVIDNQDRRHSATLAWLGVVGTPNPIPARDLHDLPCAFARGLPKFSMLPGVH